MFNESDFMKAKFTHRTKKIAVPELKKFFGKADPVWAVRGLTGEEIAHVNSSSDKNKMLLALATALKGNSGSERVDALKDLLGVNKEEVPADLIRRKEMLVAGSIDPVCSEELAIKLAQAYPTVFFQLSQEITTLTGLGQDPGKPKPSGKKKESKKA